MRKFVSLLSTIGLLCATMPATAGNAMADMNFDDMQASLNTNLVLVADDAGGDDVSKPKVSTLPYSSKSPRLSGGLSLVLPGAGQIYNGQYFVGGLWMAGEIALYMSAFAYSGAFSEGKRFQFRIESQALIAVALGLHLFSIYDALTESQLMNDGLDKWNVAVAPLENGATVAYQTRW